jgi:hypothetical protein
MIKKIYLDADDVCTDFNNHYEKCFGRRWKDIPEAKDRWEPLNKNPNWFETIPKKSDASILIEFIRAKGIPFKILTATGWNWIPVGAAKMRYFVKEFGIDSSDVLTVINGTDKFRFAQKGSLLIDDMERNVDPWIKAGGIGIVHKSAEQTIRTIKQWHLA